MSLMAVFLHSSQSSHADFAQPAMSSFFMASVLTAGSDIHQLGFGTIAADLAFIQRAVPAQGR